MQSYPCVGTTGRGTFPLAIRGEPFRGVVRFHRVGTVDATEAYYAEVLDKNNFGGVGGDNTDEWPDGGWWNTPHDAEPQTNSRAVIFDEHGNMVCELPPSARVVSLATEDDYYGRILLMRRRLEHELGL